MSDINMKKFVEQPTEEVIKALAAYKKQNPAKYEAKKEALFKKYGIESISEEVEKGVEEELNIRKSKKVNIV
jgi:sulfite reductase beta subunit-like hemoprotein